MTANPAEGPEGKVVIKSNDGQPFRITSMVPPIIKELPAEASLEHELLVNWERGGDKHMFCRTIPIDEYSLSYIGPRERYAASKFQTVDNRRSYARAQATACRSIEISRRNFPRLLTYPFNNIRTY